MTDYQPGGNPAPFKNGHDAVHPKVAQDIMARMDTGIETYGVALQPGNGRDAILDAYEELLDAACYLKQFMIERELAIDALSQAAGVIETPKVDKDGKLLRQLRREIIEGRFITTGDLFGIIERIKNHA